MGLAVICLGFGAVAAADPKVSAEGVSLVVEPAGGKQDAPGDTLYDLLSQEIQVFIFNNKTRVWPQVNVRYAPGTQMRLSNPQVEGLIHKYAHLYRVDPMLVRAVMRHESGFNPNAVSPKGAQGLMQLMPGTAALMGVRNPYDPEQNVAGGVGYLRRCLDRFGNNVPLAVAAYNAGPEAVAKYCAVPPFSETKLFVHNVMGTYGGPPQMQFRPGAAHPAKSGAKAVKGKKGGKAAEDSETAAAAQPRRPKAKIIEVRPTKKKSPSADDDAD